jgi:hypothetical protein
MYGCEFSTPNRSVRRGPSLLDLESLNHVTVDSGMLKAKFVIHLANATRLLLMAALLNYGNWRGRIISDVPNDRRRKPLPATMCWLVR